MRLQYEISAVGERQLYTVFRGIERESAASNRRQATETQRTAQRTARESSRLMREAAGPTFGPGRKEQVAAIRANERAAIASARAEMRARLQGERELARAKDSLDRQRSRGLMAQFNAQQREERKALTERQSRAGRIGRAFVGTAGGAVGNVIKAGALATSALGGFAIAGALSEETDVRRKASQLANSAGAPEMKGQLAKESTGVRGFTGSETLDAMGKFVEKTGDLGAARGIIQDMGALSLATSSDFGEMGEAAGQAFNVIRDTIKDPHKQIEALNDVMRTLADQGNLGAVEIKDMATELAGLGAASRAFKGGPVDLLKTMGAMAQASVARGGSRDAAEATTAVTRFAADLTKKPAQKALHGLGIDVFADKGKTQLKDPREIMADILGKTGGDLTKVEDILNAESKKALQGFSPLYLEAERKKKGTGKQALMDEFARFKGANLTAGEIQKRAGSRLEDPDMQFKEAMKAFNTAVGRELLPAVTKLIPEFSKLLPHVTDMANALASFVGWAAENPLSGIGAVIAASVAKDVATAGISSALSGGVTNLVAGMTAAQLGIAKLGAASAFAAAAWYVAYDQNESLKKTTGGLGIGDLVWGSLTEGKGFMEQINEKQDAEAREDAKRRALEAPGTVQLNGKAASTPAATSPGESKTVPGGPVGAGAGADNGAKDMKEAAAALKAAAASMGAGKGGADPSRTAPIVSPSRT